MNIKKFLISLAALIMIATSLSGLSKVNADNVTSPQVKKIKREELKWIKKLLEKKYYL